MKSSLQTTNKRAIGHHGKSLSPSDRWQNLAAEGVKMSKTHSSRGQASVKAKTIDVIFAIEASEAQAVYLCGDFNDWSRTGLDMIRHATNGKWEKHLALQPGRYEYKFLVDGEWVNDPRAKENVRNIHGSLNSVVEVLA